MRQRFKQIIALLCGTALLGSVAQAATIIDYDTDTRTLQIKGDFSGSSMGTATFSILPAGVDPQQVDINTANTTNMLYRTLSVQDDGSISSTIVLPEDFENGQYVLRTYQDSLLGTNYFGFVGSPIPASDLQMANSAASKNDVLAALQSLSSLGLESSVIEKYGNTIAEYVFTNRPDGGYTGTSLMEAVCMGEAMGRLAAKDIGLEDMLTAYSAYVEIDYEEDFASLPADIQNEMNNLFAQMENPSGEFNTLFADTLELAQMKCADSFLVLQQLYLAYAGRNDISLDEYQNLSNEYIQDQVFVKLLESISSASSMEDVNALFHTALDEAQKEENPSDDGHRGGGGGGGGGGNAATYLPSQSEQTDEPQASPDGAFTDTAQHWAEGYILQMKERGAVNGFEDGSFRPDQAVTRAEFVKMLCELLQLPTGEGTLFTDVTADDWFYGVVYAAYDKGIIRGTAADAFSPNEMITREDAAVIIQRTWPMAAGEAVAFADSPEISDYAVEAINALTSAGVLTGYEDNTIAPKASLTRAEAVTMLCRVLDQVNG